MIKGLIDFLGTVTLVVILTMATVTIAHYVYVGLQASGGFELQVPYVAGANSNPDHGLFRR